MKLILLNSAAPPNCGDPNAAKHHHKFINKSLIANLFARKSNALKAGNTSNSSSSSNNSETECMVASKKSARKNMKCEPYKNKVAANTFRIQFLFSNIEIKNSFNSNKSLLIFSF